MAKRPTRSEANDLVTEAPQKPRARARSARELAGAVANREPDVAKFDADGGAQPENISGALAGGGRKVQQSPGNGVAARTGFGTAHDASELQPSEEDIRRRAYEMYLERGGSHGSDFEDWVRAEEELRRRKR
jgi:Protein of unknown function (DUF2934)